MNYNNNGQMSHKTLYLLVSCCMEETRFNVLEQVVASLLFEQKNKNFSILDNLVVFDNGSTYPGTIELLKTLGGALYMSPTNTGYW